MRNTQLESLSLFEQGVATRAIPGQDVCGDSYLVQPVSYGVLLAAIDGLGHGMEAVAAARAARASLLRHAEEPLNELMGHCHQELIKTRGVVMTLASISPASGLMTWLGVGNVEGVLMREHEQGMLTLHRAVLRNGILGYQMPVLQPSTLPIAAGDLLVFVTDGIAAGFTEDLMRADSAQAIADRVLKRHFRGTDDALVLAVRYPGGQHE